MAKIQGYRMICWRGDELTQSALIGGTTQHTLSIKRSLAEISGETQGAAREYLPDALEWSLQVTRLILASGAGVTVADEVGNLKDGDVINVCVQIGWDYFKGSAIVNKVTVHGPLKGKSTASISLNGTGALTKVTNDDNAFGLYFTLTFGSQEINQ